VNRPRIIRRAIGGLLLGAALSATLIPAAQSEVTQTYGRVAPIITSGSAQWVASAQGESIDNNSTRGRAAVRAADAITEAERRSGTRPAHIWALYGVQRRKVEPA
jgi:hypothetical protein